MQQLRPALHLSFLLLDSIHTPHVSWFSWGGRNYVSPVFTSMRPKMWIKGCHWVISQWRRSRVSGENINKNWTSFQNWRQESTTGQRGFQEPAGDTEGQALALYCLWKLCLLYVLRLWFSESFQPWQHFTKHSGFCQIAADELWQDANPKHPSKSRLSSPSGRFEVVLQRKMGKYC